MQKLTIITLILVFLGFIAYQGFINHENSKQEKLEEIQSLLYYNEEFDITLNFTEDTYYLIGKNNDSVSGKYSLQFPTFNPEYRIYINNSTYTSTTFCSKNSIPNEIVLISYCDKTHLLFIKVDE